MADLRGTAESEKGARSHCQRATAREEVGVATGGRGEGWYLLDSGLMYICKWVCPSSHLTFYTHITSLWQFRVENILIASLRSKRYL